MYWSQQLLVQGTGKKKQTNKKNRQICQVTIERRSVTSRYHGSNISGSLNNGELKRQRRRRQRERQKSNRFILAKQQLCTCITLFCTFLSRLLASFLSRPLVSFMSATWNFLTSRARFMDLVGEQSTRIFFFFFRIQPQTFSPKFYLNKIDEV